jgi:hypothetical protein
MKGILMKKIVVLILALMFCVPAYAGQTERHPNKRSLMYKLSKYGPPVKVFVADVKDSAGNSGTVRSLLKTNIEKMLPARKNMTFEVVASRTEADVILDSDIVEYLWTDSDPIDSISGIGPILMDAAMKENYGRLQAVFTMTDVKTGKEIWEKKIQATITGNHITPENAAELLSARMMKVITSGNLKKRVRTSIMAI